MRSLVKALVNKLAKRCGYDLVPSGTIQKLMSVQSLAEGPALLAL
jgi:hypothetical protein